MVSFYFNCANVSFPPHQQEMTPEEKATITDLKKCDFNQMNEYFKAQSEARKAMSKEEKLVRHELGQREVGACFDCLCTPRPWLPG